jgi:hypothetical protein
MNASAYRLDPTDRKQSTRDKGSASEMKRMKSGQFFRQHTSEECPVGMCCCCGGHESCKDPKRCARSSTWDGKHPAACEQNSKGQLCLQNGEEFCFDFNLPCGCRQASDHVAGNHVDRHICSICSDASHNHRAQRCPCCEGA